MAAVNFDVDTDNLRAGVRDMREQLSAMKEGRDALATSVAEVESTWEGPAKNSLAHNSYATVKNLIRYIRLFPKYSTGLTGQQQNMIHAMHRFLKS